MRYVCLRCGNVTEVLAEGGRCPMCGAEIAVERTRGSVRDDSTGTRDVPRRNFSARRKPFASESHVSDDTGESVSATAETWSFGLFWAAAITYPLGIFLPLATISKHVTGRDVTADEGSMLAQGARWLMDFFDENPTLVDEKNTFSLASGLVELLTQGQIFLFLVVLVFSVLFPLTKLAALGHVVFGNADAATRERQLARLSFWGKWSMLDVFVIALLVVSLKLGDLVDVQIHCGIYFFAASVLLTMLLTQLLHKAFPVAARR